MFCDPNNSDWPCDLVCPCFFSPQSLGLTDCQMNYCSGQVVLMVSVQPGINKDSTLITCPGLDGLFQVLSFPHFLRQVHKYCGEWAVSADMETCIRHVSLADCPNMGRQAGQPLIALCASQANIRELQVCRLLHQQLLREWLLFISVVLTLNFEPCMI